MSWQNLLRQSSRLAVLIGSILALYISLTTFWPMPHRWWLAGHNLLVVISLFLVGFIGYRHRECEASFTFMLLSVGVFFSAIMFLYIGSYVVVTAFFADRMVWIPFFYHDFNHHGFESVKAYLDHKNNFRELLALQIFSFLIGAVMYFGAGSLGYGVKVIINGMKRSLRAV